ncbi:MAG: DUF3300 domain-containing protein [Armatimonadota bacterium]
MNNNKKLYITVMVILISLICVGAWSQTLLYSDRELDVIMGPIALYPDPLIAQILPACTYHDQLVNADYYVGRDYSPRDLDSRDWDVSVRALTYYPSVLHGLANKPNWTIAVGQAYVNEPTHVMWSIQRLRSRARQYGYLTTNRYQRVYNDGGYYRIVPVQPRYIYVPQYDPQIVYVQRRSSLTSNLISFGLGLLIGSWLNRDVDWHRHRVYYHGWDDDDDGWVRRSRRYVTINNYYVNNDYRDRPISVDRNIRTRDLGDFRTVIRQSASSGSYRLPLSRESGRQSTMQRRSIPQQRTVTGRTTQGSGRVDKVKRDRAVTRQSGRTSSVRTAPSSKRSVTRSNTKPVQSNIRKDTSRGTKSPSIKSSPRSSQKNIRSGAKSDRTITKSRSTSGTKKVSTRSGSKESGKNKDDRSKANPKRR